jgi:hypothetical protein
LIGIWVKQHVVRFQRHSDVLDEQSISHDLNCQKRLFRDGRQQPTEEGNSQK